jgi:hypothetical protein
MRIGLIFVAGLAASCTNLPDNLQPGMCGNHVVESGEACDSADATCGAPDSMHPCQNICPDGRNASCPAGSFCGSNGVCNKPTSTYHMTGAVGDPANQFQLLSFGGSQFLAERTPQKLIFYKNQGGQFALVGSGPLSEPRFPQFSQIRHRIDLGAGVSLLAQDQVPSAVVLTNSGIDLMAVDDTGLRPLLLASRALDDGGGNLRYVTSMVFDPKSPAEPLMWDQAGHQLISFDLSTNPPSQDLTVDISPCGMMLTTLDVAQPRRITDSTVAAVVFDQKKVCAIVGTSTGPLPARVLTDPNLPGHPVTDVQMADLDGNQLMDVVGTYDNGNGDVKRVSWLQTAIGTFSAPAIGPSFSTMLPNSNVQPPVYINGDLNGDKKDDVYGTDNNGVETIFFNNNLGAVGGGGFLAANVQFDTTLTFYSKLFAIGDIDRNGNNDLIIGDGTSDYSTCLSDLSTGSLRFNCVVQQTGLSSTKKLVVGDVNGDLTNDVIAIADTGASILKGEAFGLPRDAPTVIGAYHGRLIDMAGSPPESAIIAKDLLATMGLGGSFGFNVGQSNGGDLTFGLKDPDNFIEDLRYVDENGDGLQDIALAVNGNSANEAGEIVLLARSSGGFDPVRKEIRFASGTGAGGVRFVTIGNDSQPSIVWVVDQLNDASTPTNDPCPTGAACVYVARRSGNDWTISKAIGPRGLFFDPTGQITAADFLASNPGTEALQGDFLFDDVDGDGALELVGIGRGSDGVPHLVSASLPATGTPQVSDLGALPTAASRFYIVPQPNGQRSLFVTVAASMSGGDDTVQMTPFVMGKLDTMHTVTDPVLFPNDPATKLDPGSLALGHMDLNGDGIEDLVFLGPDGVRAAIADVEKP